MGILEHIINNSKDNVAVISFDEFGNIKDYVIYRNWVCPIDQTICRACNSVQRHYYNEQDNGFGFIYVDGQYHSEF